MADAVGEEVAATGDPARFAEAHRLLRADASIQFEMKAHEAPPVPGWVRWLNELLDGSGPFFKLLFWVAVAAAILFVLYRLARWIDNGGLQRLRRRRDQEREPEAVWRPEEKDARALVGEAERLAATGRFSEAAHLLLFRSIEDIERRRPELVRPTLTSRDIAGAPQLPPGSRSAFSRIVMIVEQSLFGGRALAEPDWKLCRASYEEFAFAADWKR